VNGYDVDWDKYPGHEKIEKLGDDGVAYVKRQKTCLLFFYSKRKTPWAKLWKFF
jgi:hypothetical protein